MKNIKLYTLMILSMLFFAACEDDPLEDNRLLNEQRVYFSSANISTASEAGLPQSSADGTIVNASNSFDIIVERSGKNASQAITANLVYSAAYVATTDFQNEGDDALPTLSFSSEGVVTIPAGEYTGVLKVIIQDDILSAGDKLLKVSLSGVSDNAYQVGFPSTVAPRTELEINIQDDDCPIDLAGEYVGEWEVASFCAAPDSFNDGFCVGSQVGMKVEFAIDPTDPVGTTGIFSGGIHVDDMTVKFQTCPQTVSIGATHTLSFNQNGNPATISPPDEPEVYGTGTYDPENKIIRVVGTYSNTAGINFDEFIIEYKKVN